MNIVALIQARMGSSRLPCKMMLSLHGMPLIDWVVQRTAKATRLNHVVVATSDDTNNNVLEAYLKKQHVDVFRGDENDVLARFYHAATKAKATHIVRICADNPLIWGGEIDALINEYFAQPNTKGLYCYNHIPRNNLYPDGLGAEIISYELLTELYTNATLAAHREHCLSYIWDNPAKYTIHTFNPQDAAIQRPDVKLDVDTLADYQKLALMDIYPTIPPQEIVALYPHEATTSAV